MLPHQNIYLTYQILLYLCPHRNNIWLKLQPKKDSRMVVQNMKQNDKVILKMKKHGNLLRINYLL
ncbi:unnamed protein product [Paramecium pentaurelia]|uniref:Uncharacterized protein n=1 Tax=Paramecium pentaurelia TaxID=43138 RepID=A0A8S1Y2W4_9CILI|nr:unnamed protein product [Paramecium pentaurelia]